MKRVLLILGALLVAALLVPALGTVAICDGWYDLAVEINPESAADVRGVSYLGVNSAAMAEAVVANVDNELKFMEHRTTAEPFTVSVGFSFRESPFGIRYGHVQEYSHLIVVLDRDDGLRAVHIVPVPHRNVSKRIVVSSENAVKANRGLTPGG